MLNQKEPYSLEELEKALGENTTDIAIYQIFRVLIAQTKELTDMTVKNMRRTIKMGAENGIPPSEKWVELVDHLERELKLFNS